MTKPRKNKTNFDYVCLMSVMRVSFCVRSVCVLVDAYVCITHHQTNTYTPKTPKRPNNQPTTPDIPSNFRKTRKNSSASQHLS